VFAGVRRLADAPDWATSGQGAILPLQLDVTDPGSVGGAYQRVADLLEGAPLTALVNNAGIGVVAPMETIELAELQAVWDVNVLGVVRVTQAFLPLMAAGSRLLILGSIGDRLTVPFGGPLTSSKWAVASVAEAFRLELVPRGIAVTLVEPGSIRSDAITKVAGAAATTAQNLNQTDPPLAERFRRAVDVALAQERNGSDPLVVAKAIARALDADRAPTRILVGRHARLMATAAAILPDRALDQVRLRLFRQPLTHGA
jgi:NAD(P)-dependent dehydrogenase (short-subunit alcohol dehydrogenase family)